MIFPRQSELMQQNIIMEKKTTILPRIQEVCNGLPYHDMYGIGWANLVDRNINKSYITLGQNIQNQ